MKTAGERGREGAGENSPFLPFTLSPLLASWLLFLLGPWTLLLGPSPSAAQLPPRTNAVTVRVVLMLPADWAGQTYSGVTFDLRGRDELLLWPCTNCATGGGGTNITVQVVGVTNLNGLSDAIQTFATSTAGADFAIVSAAGVHTFRLPTASAVNRGALSSADWITFNNKQAGDADLTALAAIAGVQGDILYHNGVSWVALSAGTSGFKLETRGVGANPVWDTDDTGGAGGAATNALAAILTNGTPVSSVVTQLNLINANGIRWSATDVSGAVTITPVVTNAIGMVWTNYGGNNVAQTNNLTFTIPGYAVNMTANSDGLTVLSAGYYYVHCKVSYGLTANDWVGMVITTNDVDFPPSTVAHYYDTASAGSLLYTNQMVTASVIRLVANDRLRVKRWYGNGAGNVFQTHNLNLSAYRIGDF